MGDLFKYLLTGITGATSYFVGKWLGPEAAAAAAGFVGAVGAWIFHRMDPPAAK